MLRPAENVQGTPDVGRLTFLAACIGGLPVFTFLVVVWLTGGAPLTPLGAIDHAAAADRSPAAPVADLAPLPETAAKITMVPAIAAEPVTFGIAR